VTNVTSIHTSHDRRLRHPLSRRLYMGNWHGEQHAGARADPKQLVASQQCGNSEAGSFVLSDYVIATCSKFNASVKINVILWKVSRRVDRVTHRVSASLLFDSPTIVRDLRLTGKHLGDGGRDVDIRQALVAAGVKEPQHGAIVQGDPNAQTPGIRHARDGATRVAAHNEAVLDVQRVGIEDLYAIVAAAPELPGDREHSGYR